MKTFHKIYIEKASRMKSVDTESVSLVVTSPPYPMIEMWDDCFITQDPAVKNTLEKNDGFAAFERMHKILDKVWAEVYRVLRPGGVACINIGDATRTLNERFVLYPNHSRILINLLSIGFSPLPGILWRKQTNAPNKFMGSGMLPPGAYITLEHEHILVLRKGDKRAFPKNNDKQTRRESAYFWEERNNWFSDVWMDIKGTRQKLGENNARLRSAAFPFEIPYRLINMFSVKEDTVLDPFLGTGTTAAAAVAAGRNSIGFEIEADFETVLRHRLDTLVPFSNDRIRERLSSHEEFIEMRYQKTGGFKYKNQHYGFPVVTNQETSLLINSPKTIRTISKSSFEASYETTPQSEFCRGWDDYFRPSITPKPKGRPRKTEQSKPPSQQKLF
jgi:DNA modification methylase